MTGHGVRGTEEDDFMNHDDHEHEGGFVSVVAVVVFLTEQ